MNVNSYAFMSTDPEQLSVTPEYVMHIDTNQFVAAWSSRMAGVIQSTFGRIKTNEDRRLAGTHAMRRLYVAYGYLLFAQQTMKETGFAARVLAHESYSVSLYYTSLKIITGTSGKKNITAAMQGQLDSIQEQLQTIMTHLSVEKPEPDLETEFLTFTTVDGSLVQFPKPAKKPRLQPDSDRDIAYGLDMADILARHNVVTSGVNLALMGVRKNSLAQVKAELKNLL